MYIICGQLKKVLQFLSVKPTRRFGLRHYAVKTKQKPQSLLPFCKAFSQFSAVLDSRTSLRIYKHLNRLSYVKEYGAELIVFR